MLLNIRMPATTPRLQLLRMLRYNVTAEDRATHNVANVMRKILVEYIMDNAQELSLSCDGNCYNHSDGTVAACYEEYLTDAVGDFVKIREIEEETLSVLGA